MKNEMLLRWLSMAEKWRWLTLAGLLAGILLLACLLWLAPAWRQQRHQQAEALQQQQGYQQLLAPLRHLPALQAIQTRNQQLLDDMVRAGAPFSLYTLLQRSGGELDRWQPASRDSQLQLWLEWPQLRQLFAYLAACEPAPALKAFTVQHKAERLYATFQLELNDDASVN